jgi:hypothetical protein
MTALRERLRAVVPRRIAVKRLRKHQERLRAEWGHPEMADCFIERFGDRVVRGPLVGVRVPGNLLRVADAPALKMSGAYEHELHGVLDGVVKRAPSMIVDIGTAEGLYAVGLARMLPGTSVIGFEIDDVLRARAGALARANDVAERVDLRGAVDATALRRLDLPGAFVLSDCEGHELKLFDRALISALCHAELLIETHDTLGQTDVRDVLLRRLEVTHAVSVIELESPAPSVFPELAMIEAEVGFPVALRSRNTTQVFLHAVPRSWEGQTPQAPLEEYG